MEPYQQNASQRSRLSGPAFAISGAPEFDCLAQTNHLLARAALLTSPAGLEDRGVDTARRFDALSGMLEARGRGPTAAHFEDLIAGDRLASLHIAIPGSAPSFDLPHEFFRSQFAPEEGAILREEAVLQKYYRKALGFESLDDDRYVLQKIPTTDEELAALTLAIATFEARQELIASQTRLQVFEDQYLILSLKLDCLTIPFGSNQAHREILLDMQAAIDRGEAHNGYVEVSGPLSPDIVAWSRSHSIDDIGPVPDVEIVYRIKLPSGAYYRIILKASVNLSSKPRNTYDKYSKPDWQVIYGLTEYIATFEGRRDLLFLDSRPRLTPDAKLSEQIIGREKWEQEYWNYLTAPPRVAPNDVRIKTRWSHPEMFVKLNRLPLFQKFMRAELERLHETIYNIGDTERFRASPEEIDGVVREYSEVLFKRYGAGGSNSRGPDITEHAARNLLSYLGPEGGYGLPFVGALADMLLAYRAKKRKGTLSSKPAKIMPEIREGESVYDIVESFPRIQDIPALFAATDHCRRRVEIDIYDPKDSSNPRRVTYGAENAVAEGQKLTKENLSRLFRFVNEQNGGPAPWKEVLLCALEQRANLSGAASALRKSIRAQKSMKDGGNPAAIEECEETLEDQRSRLQHLEFRILDYTELILPLWCKANLARLYVQDSVTRKFIYTIDRAGLMRVAEEIEGKNGAIRVPHSCLAGGQTVFGAGQITFELFRRRLDYQKWLQFNEEIKQYLPSRWSCVEIDNFTGHYVVDPRSLPYAGNIVLAALNNTTIRTDSLVLNDRAASPGLVARGFLYGRRAGR